jgi:hypothetical protein
VLAALSTAPRTYRQTPTDGFRRRPQAVNSGTSRSTKLPPESALGRNVAYSKGRTWWAEFDEIRKRERFFHWELEFPEVFFGERRGFDAVLGKPHSAFVLLGMPKALTEIGDDP